MSISRDQALAMFHERYPQGTVNRVEISDTLPTRCCLYNAPTDSWFVLFSTDEFLDRLQSGRLMAISKTTGEIVYDGDANDEG
jgi:hypothetical protein